MIKRLLKLAVSSGVHLADTARTWGCRMLKQPCPARVVVLYYHAIKPDRRSRFARQMDELLRRASPFGADGPPPPPEPGLHVAVTFDDGFVSVIEQALPELKKRNIPFTVFVPTGCLGNRPAWIRDDAHPSWGERVVSAEELRALAVEPLVSIGSHSVTHPDFRGLSADEAEQEFVRSKSALETILGREVTTFSYPHGAHNPRLDQAARAAGYRRVFTIEPEARPPAPQNGVVGRVLADPDDWGLEFRLKLQGSYRWLGLVGSLKRRFPRRGGAA